MTSRSWHFNGTYHYYKLSKTVTDQWDVGGLFPGDTKGQYAAETPEYLALYRWRDQGLSAGPHQ